MISSLRARFKSKPIATTFQVAIVLFIFVVPLLRVPGLTVELSNGALASHTGTSTYPMTYLFACSTVALVFLLLLFWWGVIRKEVKLHWSAWYWLGVAWVASRVLSAVLSNYRGNAFLGGYGELCDGILYPVYILVLLYLFRAANFTKKQFAVLVKLFVLQVSILCISALVEVYQNGQSRLEAGPLYNPDFLISYLITAAPFAFIPLFQKFGKGIRSRVYLVEKAAYLIASILILWTLFFCVPVELRQKLHLAGDVDTKQSQSSFLGTESNTQRWKLWEMGVREGSEQWLTGVGPGAAYNMFYTPEVQKLAGEDWDYSLALYRPHNDFIEQYLDYGVVGLLVYFVLVVGVLFAAFRRLKGVEVVCQPLVWAGLLGFILFLLFNQLLFTVVPVGIAVAFCLSAIFAGREEGDDRGVKLPGILLIIASFTIFLGAGSLNKLSEAEMNNYCAVTAYQSYDFKTDYECSTKAVSIYPDRAEYHFQRSLSAFYYSGIKGVAAEKQNELQKVYLPEATEAVRLQPNIPQYRIHQISMRYATATDSERTELLSEYISALEISPWNTASYRTVWSIVSHFRSAEAAKSDWERVIESAPAEMFTKLQLIAQTKVSQ